MNGWMDGWMDRKMDGSIDILLWFADEVIKQVAFCVIPMELYVRSEVGAVFVDSAIWFIGVGVPVCVEEVLFSWQPEPVAFY